MKPFLAILMTILCLSAATVKSTKGTAKKQTRKTTAKTTAKQTTRRLAKAVAKIVHRPAPVSAASRASAREEIDRRIAATTVGVENPSALAGYFAALDHATESGKPVHILQFGDSHTASDDWVNAMRTAAQSIYGDGGPGYVHPGRPFLGYRRFDASGANSAGWKTDGNKSRQADPDQGLSHVSISTSLAYQTVRLAASGESIGIFYMRQHGGGQFEVTFDDDTKTIVSTDLPKEDASSADPPNASGNSDPQSGYFVQKLAPGRHEVVLRTLNFAPVRLFGWTVDNSKGVTFETLGINGALASKLLDANERIWASEVAERDPALIILAYGTNEANSHLWTADQYRADLTEIIARIRRAAPNASILMVGPPDCGKTRPLLHLTEVIDIQRQIAGKLGVAFWDWRLHMGGERIVSQWALAGLGQADFIHLTGDGYRLIGNLLFNQIEKAHSEAHHD
jgi:lysophospholipase L1-like esterase